MNVKDLEDERNMRELWLIFVHRSLLWAWISLEKSESKPRKRERVGYEQWKRNKLGMREEWHFEEIKKGKKV